MNEYAPYVNEMTVIRHPVQSPPPANPSPGRSEVDFGLDENDTPERQRTTGFFGQPFAQAECLTGMSWTCKVLSAAESTILAASMLRIRVIDDEPKVARALRTGLESRGIPSGARGAG
jgi:hypothetical protein